MEKNYDRVLCGGGGCVICRFIFKETNASSVGSCESFFNLLCIAVGETSQEQYTRDDLPKKIGRVFHKVDFRFDKRIWVPKPILSTALKTQNANQAYIIRQFFCQ